MISIETLIELTIPPILLIFGIFGNIAGLIVISRKKLHKIGPQKMYQYLFMSDSFILTEIIINYLQYGFNVDFTTISSFTCKLFHYLNYSFANISSMVLVYISVERFVTTKYPIKTKILRDHKNQLCYFCLVIAFNLIYYIPIPFFFSIIKDENDTIIPIDGCDFIDLNNKIIMSYMDLVNRAIVPFTLMILCTALLVYSIWKSRQRVYLACSLPNENRRIKKDAKLALTLIFIDLVYIIFNLPYSATIFLSDYNLNFFYIFSYFLFYASFAVNFYILLLSNSLFRNEFLHLLWFKTQTTPINVEATVSNQIKSRH